MREEVLAAVADAWAELQAIEARTKLQVEQAYAQWRDEEVRLRRHREREHQGWQEMIDGLHVRQSRAIDGTEALAQELLDYVVALRDRAAEVSAAARANSETSIPSIEFYWHDARLAPSTPPADARAEPDAITGDRVALDSSQSTGYAHTGVSSGTIVGAAPRESESASGGSAGLPAPNPIRDEG